MVRLLTSHGQFLGFVSLLVLSLITAAFLGWVLLLTYNENPDTRSVPVLEAAASWIATPTPTPTPIPQPYQLFSNGGDVYMTWSDAHQHILFQDTLFEGGERIYVYGFAPDGQRVAFESEHEGNLEVYVVNIDGMLIGYVYAEANRDESVSELGYEFDVSTICEMVASEKTIITFQPKR